MTWFIHWDPSFDLARVVIGGAVFAFLDHVYQTLGEVFVLWISTGSVFKITGVPIEVLAICVFAGALFLQCMHTYLGFDETRGMWKILKILGVKM